MMVTRGGRPVARRRMTTRPPPRRRGRDLTHRILIIDDETEVRDFLVDLLTRFGHHADSTGNGREALTMLAERSYALIPRSPERFCTKPSRRGGHIWPPVWS